MPLFIIFAVAFENNLITVDMQSFGDKCEPFVHYCIDLNIVRLRGTLFSISLFNPFVRLLCVCYRRKGGPSNFCMGFFNKPEVALT